MSDLSDLTDLSDQFRGKCRVLPKIDPLRPVKRPAVPVGPAWVYELKLDGFRGVLSIEGGHGWFTSKTSKAMPRFQDLAGRLAAALPVRDVILDGEIVVMGETGPDFFALFSRRGEPAYAAFDLLWLNGRDLRGQALWRRKQALRKLVDGTPIGYVDHVDDPGLFAAAVERDIEGIVAKRRSDPFGQDVEWVKVKNAGYSQNEGRGEIFHRRTVRSGK